MCIIEQEMDMNQTFTLSIEDTAGHSFLNGFHLGTQEPLARQIAEEKFHARRDNGLPIVTVALIQGRKIVDVYDGTWFSTIA
jgi:C4-type Zn-finger protein